jgi:two-component system nitrate/nitrite sensor histidine kinase NarX
MQQLETITPFGPIEVNLSEPGNQRSYRKINTHSLKRPDGCKNDQCYSCIDPEEDQHQYQKLSLPIQTAEVYFGKVSAHYLQHQLPSNADKKLLQTIVENLATSMSLELKANQEQHMSLMEERTVIARELHDSLAQSLSYLKMQVTRLQLLRKKDADDEEINDVILELKDALNNAYRQLRELLTTFRLKLDDPGLEPALKSTISEFSKRLERDINYHYSLSKIALTPNEEIHVLQLIREALANVVKHADSSEVTVNVSADQALINVLISDNGVGLPDNKTRAHHYGLAIMQDRSDSLGGQLNIENRAGGGTRVLLKFKSKQH